jgi:hypothetical protein
MCPMCVTTVSWIAASATSTGGIAALLIGRLRGKKQQANNSNNNEEGERHEH